MQADRRKLDRKPAIEMNASFRGINELRYVVMTWIEAFISRSALKGDSLTFRVQYLNMC
jgi:hypothetical protein